MGTRERRGRRERGKGGQKKSEIMYIAISDTDIGWPHRLQSAPKTKASLRTYHNPKLYVFESYIGQENDRSAYFSKNSSRTL